MARSRSPAARLVLLSALLLAALVGGLQLLDVRVDRPPDPALALPAQNVPPLGAEVVTCEREQPDIEPPQRLVDNFPAGGRIDAALVLACPQMYDGRRVAYAGEVVGDLIHRDGGAWALVNDDDYALALGPLPSHDEMRGGNSGLHVWIPQEHLAGLEPGRPGRRGDVVLVEGVIRRVDPDDAGGLTLRADRLEVVAPATDVPLVVDPAQIVLAGGSCGLAGVLWLLRRRDRP